MSYLMDRKSLIVNDYQNLGLYGDRIGFLSLVLADRGCVEAVRSQLTLVLRPMYGNPCRAPARIMELILLDQARREQWAHQLAGMVDRVKKVRRSGYSTMKRLKRSLHYRFE